VNEKQRRDSSQEIALTFELLLAHGFVFLLNLVARTDNFIAQPFVDTRSGR
jgi:hypothetical protein